MVSALTRRGVANPEGCVHLDEVGRVLTEDGGGKENFFTVMNRATHGEGPCLAGDKKNKTKQIKEEQLAPDILYLARV